LAVRADIRLGEVLLRRRQRIDRMGAEVEAMRNSWEEVGPLMMEATTEQLQMLEVNATERRRDVMWAVRDVGRALGAMDFGVGDQAEVDRLIGVWYIRRLRAINCVEMARDCLAEIMWKEMAARRMAAADAAAAQRPQVRRRRLK
jgi:hypothetical protein